MKRRLITPELVEEMATSEFTINELAEMTGFSKSALRARLTKHPKYGGLHKADVTMSQVQRWYESGFSPNKIAELTGYARSTVRRHLRRFGDYQWNYSEIFPDPIAKKIALSTETFRVLAKKYKVSKYCIFNTRKRFFQKNPLLKRPEKPRRIAKSPLSDSTIRDIYYAEGSQQEIAERFVVAKSTVSEIKRKARKAHVRAIEQ